ncbi:MAG: DNA methyltransferase [Cytophagales bacterium]|nr:MAG: DNA methyltransferase [Cytophagales bacterium]TAF62117.1 MAG: DNA methyltransferase [Cytophagales bacterium]
MTIQEYINNLNQRYKLGNATEHTFRGDLQQLLESLVPEIRATNEPKRQSCGAPDYILTQKEIPVGFIEAKDIGDKDLEGAKKTGNKEQFDRYKASLNNLIFTDYVDFHLYRDGELITKIAIAELTAKGITALPQNFAAFENLIKDFCTHVGQTIKSSKKLAEMMAGKARLLSDIIGKALTSDEQKQEDSTLKDQMVAFKEILIHDITPQGFADVYAQTIAYGMFAARLHDPTLPTFSRQEAAELIPKSNPFLRKLFGYIAGPDIDDRIKWVVDGLVDIFLACNVEEILKNYGKTTKMEDPIIHFYETFLSEYDPKLRKARGVWYTPAPVVNFIVRAVDEILKTEFDLPQGLADSSKIKVKTNKLGKQVEEEVHRVQILDPATGTGTFLAEVVKHIHKKFAGQQGIWSRYIETHLLPRLNGFELLMASYAMAHLQLDLLLTETGFKPSSNQRLRIYLTNSLEESHPDTGTLFANWLSQEANEANHIKRDAPVMCVIGNPPYSVSSSNKSEWIEKLTADYKKNMNERNIQPLSDYYIKFIRFGQHFIDKNESGVLAYISNNSFIDGIIHRQMRKNLLESFDKIYILDLHGNARKKEVCPDGSADQNVFDIMQGVSINVFVKTGKKKHNELGKVFHFDLQGKREFKYEYLAENTLESINWEKLNCINPNYFFVDKNNNDLKLFGSYIDLRLLFIINSMGIATGNDDQLVSFDRINIENKYSKATEFYYRPFDVRYTIFDNDILQRARLKLMNNYILGENLGLNIVRQSKQKGIEVLISNNLSNRDLITNHTYNFPLYLYPETNGQQSIGQKYELDELQLLELRKEELLTLIDSSEKSFQIIQKMYDNVQNPDKEIQKLYDTQVKSLRNLKLELKTLQDKLKNNSTKTQTVVPFIGQQERIPNLNKEIVKQIAEKLGLTFTNEKETSKDTFAPIDILDYIYAVLHSPTYRETYKEFLKIDFPRVPYPKDQDTFWQLVKLGGEIRQIHLLESPVVENYITQYPEDGNNVVTKIKYQDGKVYINDTQYFDNVPQVAWEFYIGGYQPAQKWLKDRKERTLEFDDILHYQKIIVALTETDRLMKAIDRIEIA